MSKIRKITNHLVRNAGGLLKWRRLLLIAIDAAIIIAVCLMAWLLSGLRIDSLKISSPLSVAVVASFTLCFLLIRQLTGIYNSVWRYANVSSYLRLVLSDCISTLLLLFFGHSNTRYYIGFGYTYFVVFGVVTLTLTSRFVYQYLRMHYSDGKWIRAIDFGISRSSDTDAHKINVAIVGAGNIGAALADDLQRDPRAHYRPFCFIDCDNTKAGSTMNGLPIFKEDENIVKRIRSMPIQEVFIALPEATERDRARLFDLYRQTKCKIKIYDFPFAEKTVDEKSQKRSIREFSIEDLLFRSALSVESPNTKSFYENRSVLVTGGGGSIGSELCRQIAKLHPKQLTIVDIYENNAYDIQQELIRHYGSKLNLKVYIASVRDLPRMDEIFRMIRPDVVFHAAAHKHVPLMEESGCEALKNNVFGTYNIANLAEKYGAKKFLLISTDKAVNPTNIMGASKRLCEMIIQCRTDSKTEFTAVRFGNVLGSNGSVIPLFRKQIQAGGPITLTDKRIIRYFMTIPEAVSLVMETCCMAKNGELYVLDMGKPVKILELAENMIRLSGFTPYEDIDIVEIGLRPGEKLYEELLMKTENLSKTQNELIFIEHDQPQTRAYMEDVLNTLREAIDIAETAQDFDHYTKIALDAIRKTVPTYHRPEEINATV